MEGTGKRAGVTGEWDRRTDTDGERDRVEENKDRKLEEKKRGERER